MVLGIELLEDGLLSRRDGLRADGQLENAPPDQFA